MLKNLKYRILIVDSDKEFVKVLKTLLESENYECETVHSGESALFKIKKKHYNLIASDINLGKISGMNLLKKVREILPTLPFIIITGHESVENSIEAINLGVTSYLRKPLDEKLTIEAFNKAIRLHKSRFLKSKTVDYSMENTFEAMVSSDEQSILKILDLVDNLIELVYPGEHSSFPDLKMAIYEGLSNAVEHGNCNNKNKLIHFTLELKMDRMIVHIKDEGEGFNYSETLNEKKYSDDLINHGLLLVQHLMDGMAFNRKGNELSLLKTKVNPIVKTVF